ncbi:hypothetical protein ADUPG1_005576, partial [Aduncisulcus paluster]
NLFQNLNRITTQPCNLRMIPILSCAGSFSYQRIIIQHCHRTVFQQFFYAYPKPGAKQYGQLSGSNRFSQSTFAFCSFPPPEVPFLAVNMDAHINNAILIRHWFYIVSSF